MTVSAELLEILACPSADHGPLRLVDAGAVSPAAVGAGPELVCTVCGSRFPIVDGIPVLLPDDAIAGPNGLGVPVDVNADDVLGDSTQ
jgi:uncharacterized protein YbaR (Trm112 family)